MAYRMIERRCQDEQDSATPTRIPCKTLLLPLLLLLLLLLLLQRRVIDLCNGSRPLVNYVLRNDASVEC